MKICVSSSGKTLDSAIDPRFGRCQVFMFVDTETMSYEAVDNPAMSAGGGAGTQAAQLVAGRGVQAVVTGNVGPNAFSALDAAGVQIYAGVSGTVQQAAEQLSSGSLQPLSQASVGQHFGSGGGRGMGGGRGGGRGRF